MSRSIRSSRPSSRLLEQLARGEIALTLTTEEETPAGAVPLLRDPLIWVGAPGGHAVLRDPVPLALGDPTCMFRRAALAALAEVRRDWRSVCEIGEMEALVATIRADLAVMALLGSTVPEGLAVLGPESGMPPLPAFTVNLHGPAVGGSEIAMELARCVRDDFATRWRRAA